MELRWPMMVQASAPTTLAMKPSACGGTPTAAQGDVIANTASPAPTRSSASVDLGVEGRAVRKQVPRSQLGAWVAGGVDRDPVAILQAQSEGRMQDLVPLRYSRMAASAFTFYRGAAALMAHDLGTQNSTGLIAQLAGDAHLANFGGFATAERVLVFDLNDFDETLPGPFEWDVKRLATSFVLAARDNGLPEKVGLAAAEAAELGQENDNAEARVLNADFEGQRAA